MQPQQPVLGHFVSISNDVDRFSLENITSQGIVLHITNLAGQNIATTELIPHQSYSLNKHELPAGLYIIHIQQGTKVAVGKYWVE